MLLILRRKRRSSLDGNPHLLSGLNVTLRFDWDKNRNESGASWILKNSDGKVLLHGRRFFSNIHSKTESSFESWHWALESMKSLHFDNIILSSEDHDLPKAITKPATWPSLKAYFNASRIFALASGISVSSSSQTGLPYCK